MAVKFLGLRPMRVLVDRSRDLGNGFGMATLAPASIFQTTDLRKGLSANLLKGYDLLCVVAVSRSGYTRAELAAIEGFVRRGGTLVLASNAGQYQLWVGEGNTDALAQNAVAELFGYRFLSSQKLPMDQGGVRGFEREEIEFTEVGRELGLQIGDVPLNRAGALAVPDEARVLLVGGRDKLPVAAWSGHGKGKVLVVHDTAIFSGWNGFIAGHFIGLVDPVARVEAKDRPVAMIDDPDTQKTFGKIVLTMSPSTQEHAKRVLAMAQRILPVATKLLPTPKGVKQWRISLEPGAGGSSDWGEPDRIKSHVGVDAADTSMAAMLGAQLVDRLLWARFGYEPRAAVRAMAPWAVDWVLRATGYGERADLLSAAIRTHPSCAQKLDFARVYSEVDTPASFKRFWFDVAEEYGDDVLTRMMKLLPEKDAYKHVDWRLWCELDVMAWLLAQVAGKGVYGWLRGRGQTVREMPPRKPGSKPLDKAMRAAMTKLVETDGEIASDRYDAAYFLADRMGEDLKEDDKVAAKVRSVKVGEALAAGIRLAQKRDIRAVGALERFLTAADKGLRGMAALALVSECGEKSASDVLLEAAGLLDTRFALAAGYALTQLGDERGRKYAFANHPACSVKMEARGQIRANPCVDGYEVCNVYSSAMLRPVQYRGAFSVYYVDWVHTAPRWRRRGIARAGMVAGLDWHWDRDCAMTSLHTGTRNVAHALYRDFGLSDYYRALRVEKVLRGESPVQPPKGIRVTVASCMDKVELMAFANEQWVIRPDHVREVGRWPDLRVAVCAHQGKRIVGFAAANVSDDGKSAGLEYLAVAEMKEPKEKKAKGKKEQKNKPPYAPREHVGQALLWKLHAELVKKGVKKIDAYYGRPAGEQETLWLLRRAGYGTQLGGGVELYRLNSLEQYLREARPAFEGRLAKAKGWEKWCGRITLRSPEQAATLVVDHGKIAVVKAQSRPAAPEVTISGSLPAIQRLVLGTTSAFEECYQIETTIEPMLNEQMTDLLDRLLPRLTPEV